MNGMEHKVLAAGIERTTFEQLAPVLRRDEVQVDWVPTPEAGVSLASEHHYDVVILDAEPADWSLESVVRKLRGGVSPSRNAAIMVLAEPDQVDAARALKTRGVNRVMLISDPPQMICQQMAGLLEVAPRVASRVPMNLQTSLGNRGREIFCQTVNLSATGMLVRTQARPQLGTPVVFQLRLSEQFGTVIGRGEMVRHASRFQGGFDGVGVRFKGFAEDGAARLREFLEELAISAAAMAESESDSELEVVEASGSKVTPEFDPLEDDDLAAFLD
jgi:DNA-binding NarL/FixJ family response regulator